MCLCACLTWLDGLTCTDYTHWEDLLRRRIVDPGAQSRHDSSGCWNRRRLFSLERNVMSTRANQARKLVLQPFSVERNRIIDLSEESAIYPLPHTCPCIRSWLASVVAIDKGKRVYLFPCLLARDDSQFCSYASQLLQFDNNKQFFCFIRPSFAETS